MPRTIYKYALSLRREQVVPCIFTVFRLAEKDQRLSGSISILCNWLTVPFGTISYKTNPTNPSATRTDSEKEDMEPTIKIQKATHDPNLVRSVIASFSELFAKGLAPDGGDIGWHWSYDAVVAYWDRNIIGFILFRHEEKQVSASIIQGYVAPSYRRSGVYTLLWNELLAELRKRGARRVYTSTHVNNAAVRTFWAKTGRKETFVSCEYEIPEIPKATVPPPPPPSQQPGEKWRK